MKHLLIIHHPPGKLGRMASAVYEGATHPDVEGVDVRLATCFESGPEDLLRADGLILGTQENFGYMSGAMKDFFDRTFYPCEGKREGLPYCLFIGCGNDGRGALAAVRRIAQGFPFREALEPVIVRGALDDDGLRRCRDLGLAMAASLEAGIF